MLRSARSRSITILARRRRRRSALLAALVALPLVAVTGAVAAPLSDHILPVDQYTSENGRRLASTYGPALRGLDAALYHCLPWLDVQKHSIGFFKPKGAAADDRYLSIRVFVEQDPSPQFAGLGVEGRASSMFSRYVGPLLRKMTRDGALLADPGVGGFAVVLEWVKQGPSRPDGRPVHETIAVFMERTAVAEYLSAPGRTRDLAARSRALGFDGETHLGQLALSGWDDDFVATYKVKNYEMAPGVSCH